MRSKLRLGILGATGTVGQRMISLVDGHPQFEVTAVIMPAAPVAAT